jgi:hypothetical protein
MATAKEQTQDVTPVTPTGLAMFIDAAIGARLPFLVAGPPGCGKSNIIEQGAERANAECMVMHPVTSDPTDFKGLPWVTKDGAKFLAFSDLMRLIKAEAPLLCFLDDLGQAPESVQAAAMQLLLKRMIGEHKVSDFVTFAAATNRRGDRAGVRGILEPVKSRFVTILHLATNIREWRKWASASGKIEPIVQAFLNFKPALLHEFIPSAEMTNSPSPRSWESLSRILTAFKGSIPRDIEFQTIEGAVGKGAAIEFTAFSRTWASMIDPDLILTTPKTAPIPDETSSMYAVSAAIAARVEKQSMGRYCTYLERLIDHGSGEFAALSLKQALARNPELCNTPGYINAATGKLGQLIVGSTI